MNDQLNQLEQSILQQDTGAAMPLDNTLSERHPIVYLGFMSLYACLGYIWTLMFPLVFLFLLVYIPYDLYQAGGFLHYSIVLLELVAAGIAGWMSYELFRLPVSYPSGRPLNQDEAPVLHTLIGELCKKHNIRRINRIRIVRDFSIELVRTPATGFPLFHSSSLLIGLPFMQSQSPRYLMAAIEREIIHLAGVHRRPASWLYFSRQTWQQYQLSWQKKWTAPSILMRAFFSWYSPLYKLLSQSACRMQHYYADKMVQAALRDQTLVNMLITSVFCAHYLENDFWPHLHNKAYRHKQPPYMPYTSLDHNLRVNLKEENAQGWLNAEMEKNVQPADVPTFRQRLERLSVYRVVLPPPVTESAARYFLGEHLKIIAGQLDQVWFKTHEFEWQQKFQQGLQQQQHLRTLMTQSLQNLLTDEGAWELLQLGKRYLGDDPMLPLCKQILQNSISEARIYFDIGRTLLTHADTEGVAAIEKAMLLDDSYTIIGCQLMTKYYVQIGNSKSAQNYRRRALAFQVNVA
jgi:hypothetical protein